jgi:hypothetical protein
MHAMKLGRVLAVCALTAALSQAAWGADSHWSRGIIAVASTDVGRHVGGSGYGNVWSTLRVNSTFSASAVRDLYVYTFWTRLSGEHLLTVRFYSPDGHLYQRLVLPVSVGRPSSPTRQVEGVETPIDVQRAAPSGRYQVTVVQLPVAGTWITEHRLLGEWRVDTLLDDDPATLATRVFTLTE